MLDSSMEFKSLLLTLKPPSQLFFSEQTVVNTSRMIHNTMMGQASFPPWPSCPDILFEQKTRAFVGLAYGVHPDFHSAARRICSNIGGNAIRYNEPCQNCPREQYGDNNWHYVEVVWAGANRVSLEPAQLAEANCFYAGGQPMVPFDPEFLSCLAGTDDQGPNDCCWYAVGVTDLDFILNAFDLTLPTKFHFTPEFTL